MGLYEEEAKHVKANQEDSHISHFYTQHSCLYYRFVGDGVDVNAELINLSLLVISFKLKSIISLLLVVPTSLLTSTANQDKMMIDVGEIVLLF
jgi:hypothetical protein